MRKYIYQSKNTEQLLCSIWKRSKTKNSKLNLLNPTLFRALEVVINRLNDNHGALLDVASEHTGANGRNSNRRQVMFFRLQQALSDAAVQIFVTLLLIVMVSFRIRWMPAVTMKINFRKYFTKIGKIRRQLSEWSGWIITWKGSNYRLPTYMSSYSTKVIAQHTAIPFQMQWLLPAALLRSRWNLRHLPHISSRSHAFMQYSVFPKMSRNWYERFLYGSTRALTCIMSYRCHYIFINILKSVKTLIYYESFQIFTAQSSCAHYCVVFIPHTHHTRLLVHCFILALDLWVHGSNSNVATDFYCSMLKQ